MAYGSSCEISQYGSAHFRAATIASAAITRAIEFVGLVKVLKAIIRSGDFEPRSRLIARG